MVQGYPRVKFFSVCGLDNFQDMESEINNWLKAKRDFINVINIQHSSVLGGESDDEYADAIFTVCILYTLS